MMMRKYNYQTYLNLNRLFNQFCLSLFFRKKERLNFLNECSLIYEFEIPFWDFLFIKFKTRARIISFCNIEKHHIMSLNFLIRNIFSDKIYFDIKEVDINDFRSFSNWIPEYVFLKKNKQFKLKNFLKCQIYFI